MEKRKAKILFYDLEVSRSIVEGYGNKWDFKVVKVVRPQMLMCFSYMWLGDKRPTWKSMHDFRNDAEMLEFLRDLFNEADVVVAHNAKKFDNRMSNRYFIEYDIDPPSPYFVIDTLQVARSQFKFESNSLGDLAEFLNLGFKEQITYADLESDFLNEDSPDVKTSRLMERYNNKDVELLLKIYKKFLPYIPNHPNMARLMNTHDACPQCGATGNKINREKYRPTKMGIYMQFKCKICKKYFQSAKPIDATTDVKPTYRNIAGN